MRMPNWFRVESSGVRFYRAWNLNAFGIVEHGFSTRIGGVGCEPYGTLNLGFNVNDDPATVVANRSAFASAIGVDVRRLVVPNQVHSNAVQVVTEQNAGSGALDPSTSIPETDALITNVPNLPLGLHFADCVCILFVDPEKRAIGVAHAGWRGTVGKIVQATIAAMESEFGTTPKSLLAAIAPAIERHCYEVGEDVAKEFMNAFAGDKRLLTASSPGKWRADLKAANLELLLDAGVIEGNIAISDACTSCDSDEFFSYRRDGITGRMGGWLSLK